MAQYVHDGGQPAGVFEFAPEWPGSAIPLTGFPENSSHPPAILDQHDTNFMVNFFQNPDGTPMSNYGDWFPSQPNMKVDSAGFDQLPPFDVSAADVNNPSVTLASHRPQNFLTHSNQQHTMPMAQPMAGYGEQNVNEGAFEDAGAMHAAAIGLHSMQMVGQQRIPNALHTSHHTHGMAGTGAWAGGMDGGNQLMGGQGQQGGHDNLRSPLTTSGRQSSNSYHSQPNITNPMHKDYLSQQQWGHMYHNPQQQAMSTSNHAGHQRSASAYGLFHGDFDNAMLSAQPRFNTVQRPTGLRFNSDESFGNGPYRAPRGSISREDEKGSNLNGVPFADELAAPMHSHAHPFTSPNVPQGHMRHSVPNSSNYPHSQPAPVQFGGLPYEQPSTIAVHRRSVPNTEMAHRSIEDSDEGDNIGGYEDPQPRKRRKSQRDTDAAYTSGGHMKTPNTKRGLKASNNGEDSDDDYTEATHIVTSSKTKSSKRRKMSGNRSSPSSQGYGTPGNSQSPTPERKSSSKKKSKNGSQSRLNLSDEQKRENHIKSEKNRRDLIKQQYDELDLMVPGLKQGKSGLSRADIILEIVSCVENLKEGNRRMAEKLATFIPIQDATGGDDDSEASEDGSDGDPGTSSDYG